MKRNTQRLKPGVNLHLIKTSAFKTLTLWVGIHCRGDEHAIPQQLLSFVLKDAAQRFAGPGTLAAHLAARYDTTLDVIGAVRGHWHSLVLSMNLAGLQFVPDGPGLFKEALQTVSDILFQPRITMGGFPADLVETAGQQLLHRCRMERSDRRISGILNCYEAITGSDSSATALTARLRAWTPQALLTHWSQMLRTAPVDLYIVGDFDEGEMVAAVGQFLHFADDDPRDRGSDGPLLPTGDFRRTETEIALPGAHLTFGFSTGVTIGSEQYPALLASLGLFGLFHHARMMVHLRHRLQLIYHARLQPDIMLGLVYLSVGLEALSESRVVETVLAQLRELQSGQFSDAELAASIASLVRDAQGIGDHPLRLIDHWVSTDLAAGDLSPRGRIAKLRACTRIDVIAAANLIQPEVIHFAHQGS